MNDFLKEWSLLYINLIQRRDNDKDINKMCPIIYFWWSNTHYT